MSFTALQGFAVVVVPKKEVLGCEGFGLVKARAWLVWLGRCYVGEELCSYFPPSFGKKILLLSDTPTLMKGSVKPTLILVHVVVHTNTHKPAPTQGQLTRCLPCDGSGCMGAGSIELHRADGLSCWIYY